MQSIDGGSVVLQLVRRVPVFLQQRLNVRLVLADVVGRHESQDVQHPGVHIVGVGQELVEVNGLCQTSLSGNLNLIRMFKINNLKRKHK